MSDIQRDARSGRIAWIDFAKGVGILLVIIGHTATVGRPGSAIRGLLFSFHMPLFFILSTMTFRCSTDTADFLRRTRRAARHLLVPGLVAFALDTAGQLYFHRELLPNPVYWRGKLYATVVASGVPQTFFGMEIPAMGIPWFFFALFFSRTLFDYLHLRFGKTALAYRCMAVSAVGVLLGREGYLPLSLDIALAIVPFSYAGHMLKDSGIWKRPVRLLAASLAVWLLTLWFEFPNLDEWTYLELACRRYPFYPICFVTALAGSLSVCAVSLLAVKAGRLAAPMSYIGRNSMYLMIIHVLDGYWYRLWGVPGRQLVESAKRIGVDLIVFAAFMLAKAGFDLLVKRARIARQARSNQP